MAIELDANQEKIYQGLKNIGEEIAGFYIGVLKIINDDSIPSRGYLIAHSAREIDGGFRDILAPKEEKQKKQKELTLEGELKKIRGHVASILVALDLPINDPFALEYINVATQFVKYSHRSGAYNLPRNSKEIITLWLRYEIVLLKLIGNFIDQLKHIERILRFEKPTSEILYTIKNIFNDNQKENYFYNNLKSIDWLDPLYENGFFLPETLHDNAYWNQSEYLEYLSIQIDKKLVPELKSRILIKIIEEICYYSINVKEINNYRIWYTVIVILTNLPKNYITKNIISSFPIFLKTKYDNTLQSDAIFRFIQSYFENEEDAEKYKLDIEEILKLVFEISDDEKYKDRSTYETGKFHPIIRSYRLKKACKSEVFYKPIAQYCSDNIILYVAEKLLIHLKSKYISSFEVKSIFNETDRNSYSIQTIYTSFLKNCCTNIGTISPIRIRNIVNKFLSNEFKHRHFTKISLFLISKNWNETKEIFFELIKNQDEQMLFSNSFWSDDLYFFLEEISSDLAKDEEQILDQIIKNGSQNERYYNKNEYLDEYKLRWYSALNFNAYFKEKYEELSKKLKKTKDLVKPKPQVYITSGSVSPISIEEIRSYSADEIVRKLKTFDPERSFNNPSVEGLTDNLNTIIKENPSLFYNNYKLFYDVPYRHISSIFYALVDAWKEDKEINWENILDFIEIYTSQQKFGTDLLKLKNSRYQYSHTSVIESFCRLLSEGMRKDSKSFSADLLPKAREIIISFLERYISTDLNEEYKGKLGSAIHVINSTTGIIIGCFINYSLRNARIKNNDVEDKSPKWSLTEKNIYENLMNKGVQEFYMHFGWKRRNFLFLDYEWTNNLIKEIPKKDIQTVKSYFGCHLLEYNTSKLDYDIFKDIYRKAITEDWQIVDSTMGESLIELHITIFYVFDYEDLEYDSLISLILKKMDTEKIKNIIHSLSFKFDQYFEELNTEKDKTLFRKKIFKIWKLTLSVLENDNNKDPKDIPTLLYLMKFIDKLDEENYYLIKKTSKFAQHGRRDLDELIKNLNRLKLVCDTEQSGIYACEIFIESIFNDIYYASIMQEEIIQFVEFYYKQESPKLNAYANKICNHFAESGQYFLRDLYERHN